MIVFIVLLFLWLCSCTTRTHHKPYLLYIPPAVLIFGSLLPPGRFTPCPPLVPYATRSRSRSLQDPRGHRTPSAPCARGAASRSLRYPRDHCTPCSPFARGAASRSLWYPLGHCTPSGPSARGAVSRSLWYPQVTVSCEFQGKHRNTPTSGRHRQTGSLDG